MAYVVMAYIVMAYIVMAYIVMAYIVMAYVAMTYIVLVYCSKTSATSLGMARRTGAGEHTWAHTRIHARVYTRVRARINTRGYARMDTCMHGRTLVCTDAGVRTRTHARMHARTHARKHARMHARTHMHVRFDVPYQAYLSVLSHIRQKEDFERMAMELSEPSPARTSESCAEHIAGLDGMADGRLGVMLHDMADGIGQL